MNTNIYYILIYRVEIRKVMSVWELSCENRYGKDGGKAKRERDDWHPVENCSKPYA